MQPDDESGAYASHSNGFILRRHSNSKIAPKGRYLMKENLKLVPDRWSQSGWAYVHDEPNGNTR